MIIWVFDDVCVFDVIIVVLLILMIIFKYILEEDVEYIWKVWYIDNCDIFLDWFVEREFII